MRPEGEPPRGQEVSWGSQGAAGTLARTLPVGLEPQEMSANCSPGQGVGEGMAGSKQGRYQGDCGLSGGHRQKNTLDESVRNNQGKRDLPPHPPRSPPPSASQRRLRRETLPDLGPTHVTRVPVRAHRCPGASGRQGWGRGVLGWLVPPLSLERLCPRHPSASRWHGPQPWASVSLFLLVPLGHLTQS